MIAAFKYLIIWLVLTLAGASLTFVVGGVVCHFLGYEFTSATHMVYNPWMLSVAMLVIDLLVLLVFWKRRYARFGFNYGFTYGEGFSTKKLFLWAAVGAIGGLLFEVLAQFYLPIPQDTEVSGFLEALMVNPLGLLVACLIGPLAEEAIFRGAIERRLLEKHWNHWYAIVISALFFAFAHFNFAQGFTAIVMGCFLGWVYYRTRSIWVTAFMHMTNNTVACLISLIQPETMKDEAFTVPLQIGIPLFVVSFILIYFAARKIGAMTDDRTPIPAPVTEVLPPPLPVEAISDTMPPEA